MTVSMPSPEVVFHHTIGLPAEISSHLVFLAKGRELGIRPNQRLTSKRRRPVIAMNSPLTTNKTSVGSNPAAAVTKGKPSMPAPMQHPAIMRMAPTNRLDRLSALNI